MSDLRHTDDERGDRPLCDCGGEPDPEFGLSVCSLPEHCEHPSVYGGRCDNCGTEREVSDV